MRKHSWGEMGSVRLCSQASIGGPVTNPTERVGAWTLGTDRLASVPPHVVLLQNTPLFSPTLSPLNTGLCGPLCQGLLVLWLPAGFGLPEAPAIDEGEGGKGAGRIYSSGFLPVMLPWSPLSLSKGPLL